MINIIFTFLSFVLLIAIIVGIHELGHFLAARKFNVHVIRFKIGFGRTLATWFDKKGTEFSLGLLPLGGYVQMLGEENPLQPDEQIQKNNFNTISYPQASLGARAIITVAGPLANFVLAVFAYLLIFMIGVKDLAPVVGAVEKDSLADKAGLEVGDKILSLDDQEVLSLKDLNKLLGLRIGETGTIEIDYQKSKSNLRYSKSVDINNWLHSELDQSLISSFGIKPFLPALIGLVEANSPANNSGLQEGDQILSVGGIQTRTWYELVNEISSNPDKDTTLSILRDGETLSLLISIGARKNDLGIKVGRIGISMISTNNEMPDEFLVETKKGLIEAFVLGVKETYSFTVLIFDSIGKMVTGSVSSENIGGPIQIAILSGSAAKAGIISFINMIALLSINLGLINLLPIPVLDGGQLVLISAEKIKGSALSERFLEFVYKIGLLFVVGLIFFAFYNDIARMV